MSETQFDAFLASQLLQWLTSRIAPGQRYQFRSSDSGNTNSIINHFRDTASGIINVCGTEISFVEVDELRLICVSHSDSSDFSDGFNENYIAMLRDRVAEQSGIFEKSALFVIHNSLLDTLVNSAIDLAALDGPWSTNSICKALSTLSKTCGKTQKVYECLLEWQDKIITEEGGSVFGFRKIFDSMVQGGVLDLRPLGLLNDSGLADMDRPLQIRRRLEENRQLHEDIDRVTHHFPDEISERLGISEQFEKKHFSESSEVKWTDIDFQVIKNEMASQESSQLELIGLESEFCSIVGPRNKSDTSAGKLRKSLILLSKPGVELADLTIEFRGDDLEVSNVRIEHNETVAAVASIEIKKTRNRRRIVFSMRSSESPQIFRIRLARNQTSERLVFSVLLLNEGQFYVKGFENSFSVTTHEDPNKCIILLQTDERELLINPDISSRRQLDDNDETVSLLQFGTVDYERIYEESDIVSFCVVNAGHSLRFSVEGEMSQQSLTLPLLMDEGRFNRLFNDNYNGTFLRDKQRVVIDNKETNVVAGRCKMLDIEQQFVEGKLLCFGDDGSSLPVGKIREPAPGLFEAWTNLNTYFKSKATIPSLSSWGSELIDLTGAYIAEYQKFLQAIELGKSLDSSVRDIMKLGIAVFDRRLFFTPFHPLILAYFRHLAIVIKQDNDIDNRSFREIPSVTRRRLNARGLIPYIYSADHEYCYTQAVEENTFWLEVVPKEESSYEYVTRLTKEKIEEFVKTFDELFKDGTEAPLLLNSVNNGENLEIFKGIVEYFRDNVRESERIHVNLFDEEIIETEFDRFAELGTYISIKRQYGLDKGKAKEGADSIIDLLRSRLTFSKFRLGDVSDQGYAHLTLFRNKQKVERVSIDINNHISGVACDGLLNGEASCSENQNYYTGFGLKGVETSDFPHLELARLVGTLQQPLVATNETYNSSSAIRLAVSDSFKELLEKSYESSIWVTIIDPKVTLQFFEQNKDVVLIHFSDQYTNSAGYDAITVSKQNDLYREILRHGSDDAVGEFNAFNGEWLLKMVTAKEAIRREREGIIGAWKLVSALVAKSEITWVPMSVAEMIRVSGNIGLRMSDGDFARYHKDKTNTGRISDDILFAGFKDGKLYLLPIEVKTGSGDFSKAHEQVRNLRKYLVDRLFGPQTLEGKINRSLLIRQVLMQVEKYELYEVFEKNHFVELHRNREEWLRGEFLTAELDNYPHAFVIGHLDSEACFETTSSEQEGVATLKFPSSYLDGIIETPRQKLEERLHSENYLNIPKKYFLGSVDAFTDVEIKSQSLIRKRPALVDGVNDEISIVAKTPSCTQIQAGNAFDNKDKCLRIEFGTEIKSNERVFWEPTNTSKVLNPNTAIIGTMGTGKTQFTKSVVTQLIRNQQENVDGLPIGVLILDYKADYVKPDFVKATNAKILNLHRLPFNPLALFGDKPMLPMHTASQFRATISQAFQLGAKQQQRINSLVIEAYEAKGIFKSEPTTWTNPAPTLNDVWLAYNAQEKVEEDSLYAALAELANFEIFEPDTSKAKSLYDMIDGVTVINLSGYDPVIQNLVVALTLDLFYAQMHQKGSSKIDDPYRQLTKFVLVDEADNFMKQEFPGLRKLLKEGREFGVGTILSTQELTHFKTANNDYSGYILSWIIHRVASIKSQDIKSLFNTAGKDEIESLLLSIKELEKHQSLYVDGEKHIAKLRDLAFWELQKTK
jgi:DNA phosphorothioation-dependent restriction protein DptH